ncbi:hypothetical protein QE152_g14225 [Popillia japonica]|uniref:Uncharacterized protein n=1 Tax=Popillia japonica TaxID=7064 RepID=A0AAW1LA20_POPJA
MWKVLNKRIHNSVNQDNITTRVAKTLVKSSIPLFEYELQPRTPLSTVSSVCSSEKTESRTVQNKRKIPKSQEEPEATVQRKQSQEQYKIRERFQKAKKNRKPCINFFENS